MTEEASSHDHDTVEEPSGHELPPWMPACEPPPTLRLGRYELRRRIGRGGMGVVYEAWDDERRERVALKMVRAPALSRMADLKREFRIASELTHRNLVTLYELAAEGDTVFFTMEYVEGTDFLGHVRSDDGADYPRIRDAIEQLARGLCALHGHGLLHQDIKPSNIRVDPHGRLVLLDFGLASPEGSQFDEWGRSVAGWGTRSYLAPERALGQKVSTASDWFSVGAVIYEALTGEVPPRKVDVHIKRLAAEIDIERLTFDPSTPAELMALCRSLLASNPAQRAHSREVARALGTDLPSEGPTSQPPARFIGRRRELDVLQRAHALACRGGASVVHVRGPSGIGKTALVREFVRTLETPVEPLLLDGRCYELESVPYKGLEAVADTIARFLLRLEPPSVAEILPEDAHLLAQIFPVFRRVPELGEGESEAAIDPHMLRRRAFRALKSLLGRLAESRPTLVVIDDLQWGDMDTLHLLNEIVSAPAPPALLLILVYRTEMDHDGTLARELARQRGGGDDAQVFDLPLGALSQDECASLARSLMQTDGDETAAAAIVDEAAGSPFLVELLTRHAGSSRQVLPSLQAALRLEIEQLSVDARRLLDLVAVSGRPLAQVVASRAGGPFGDLRATFAQLRARNLVRTYGHTANGDYEVYHDAVRASVLALMPDEVRAMHHRALAAALHGSSDSEALARHLHGAGDRAAAARHAAAAAEAADSMWAFEHAAALYAFACDCDPPNRAALSIKRADALANAGHSGEAAELFLACARESTREDLQRRAAEQFMVSGRIGVGIDTLRPVLERVGLTYPSASWRATASIVKNLARLKVRGYAFEPRSDIEPDIADRLAACLSAGRGLCSYDPLRGSDYLVQATLLALEAGDAANVARGLSYVGLMYIYLGFGWAVDHGFSLIDEAERIAREHEDFAALGWVTTVRGLASTSIGAWGASVEQIDESVTLLRARTVGTRWEQIVGLSTALLSLSAMGRIDAMRLRALELEREADEVGEVFGAVEASLYLSFADLAADAPARARRRLSDAMGRWKHEGFHFQHWTALRYWTYCDLYEGVSEATMARLDNAFRKARSARLFDNQIVRGEAEALQGLVMLAQLARKSGDPRTLERRIERAADKLVREHRDWTDASAWSLRAGLATWRGERDRAVAALRKAREIFVGAQMGLHAAVMKLRLGELLPGAAGQSLVAEARERMRNAHAIAKPERWCSVYLPGSPT